MPIDDDRFGAGLEMAAAFAELPDDQRREMAQVFAAFAVGYLNDAPDLARCYAAMAMVAAGAPDLADAMALHRAVTRHGDPPMFSMN